MTSQEIIDRTNHVATRIAAHFGGVRADENYVDAGIEDPFCLTYEGKCWSAARIATIHWTGEDPNEHYQKLRNK